MILLANSRNLFVTLLEVTQVGHLAVFVAVSVRPRSCIAVLIDAAQPPRVNVMNGATTMLSLFLIYESGEEGACSRWRSHVSDCHTLRSLTANAPSAAVYVARTATLEMLLIGKPEHSCGES